MVPVQTSPVCFARKTTVSVPARLAILRSTLNEPLRPPVVAEPFAATEPLSLIFQFQLWPDWLLSTSPSTSRRPSSVLTLSFQSAPPEQLPVLMTRSSSPPWEAYEGAPTNEQRGGGQGGQCGGNLCHRADRGAPSVRHA